MGENKNPTRSCKSPSPLRQQTKLKGLPPVPPQTADSVSNPMKNQLLGLVSLVVSRPMLFSVYVGCGNAICYESPATLGYKIRPQGQTVTVTYAFCSTVGYVQTPATRSGSQAVYVYDKSKVGARVTLYDEERNERFQIYLYFFPSKKGAETALLCVECRCFFLDCDASRRTSYIPTYIHTYIYT